MWESKTISERNAERRHLVKVYFQIDREMKLLYKRAGVSRLSFQEGRASNLAWKIASNLVTDRLAELGLHLVRCADSECRARELVEVPESHLLEKYFTANPSTLSVGQEYLPKGWVEANCGCCTQFCPMYSSNKGRPSMGGNWGQFEE